ncbi:MAG: hypothetical protein AAF937_02340 [Planctomycetota bacterium]
MRARLIVLAGCLLLGGCYAVPNNAGTASVAPGAYPAAFDAAREALVDLGFTLNRIDARAGIVTTEPLSARGLAAPWERQQASRAGEIADTVHPQSRSVRVEFVPIDTINALPSDASRNQITSASTSTLSELDTAEPLAARVTVLIERTYRPGLRPQVADVVRSRRATDPRSEAGREFTVVIQRDPALESVIADRIARAAEVYRSTGD